jgi:hypothetical protein
MTTKYIYLPWSIQSTIVAVIFIYLGSLAKQKDIFVNNFIVIIEFNSMVYLHIS